MLTPSVHWKGSAVGSSRSTQSRISCGFSPLAGCLFVSLLSLTSLTGCSSSVQVGDWEFTGGPYAQNISTILVDERNSSHLLAGLSTGEVFSSDDEGVTWAKLSTIKTDIRIFHFIQHPDDPGRIFAATASGLFLSVDSAKSWSNVVVDPSAVNTPSHILAIEPYNTLVMYAGLAGRGMYKSMDGGRTWSPRNRGLDSSLVPSSDVLDIVIDPSRPDNLYAAIKGIGIVRSVNGGETWGTLTSIIGSSGVAPTSVALSRTSSRILCFGMEGGAIYRSMDGGQTWSPTRFGTGSNNPVQLLTDPQDPEILYAGTENDILVSSDFGTTWKSIAGDLPHVATSIAVASGEPAAVLYAYGEGIGLSRSKDHARSWISGDAHLGGSTVSAIEGNLRGDVVYAAAGASVHRWTPQRGAWRSASNGLNGGAIASIALDADSSSTVYAATVTGVFKTTNAGVSWSAGSPQMRGKPISLIATHPAFKTRMLLESEAELFASTDRGSTWNLAKPLSGRYRVHKFTFSNTDAGFVLGGTVTSGVVISSNGGLTWESNRYGLESNDVSAVTLDEKDRRTLFAWTEQGRGFRTTDKGLVWDRYSPPWQSGEKVHVVFDRYNPTEVVALVGLARMYYSPSGGATWFPIPIKLLQGEATAVYWNSETATLYVGLKQVGVYRVSLKEYLRKLFEE